MKMDICMVQKFGNSAVLSSDTHKKFIHDTVLVVMADASPCTTYSLLFLETHFFSLSSRVFDDEAHIISLTLDEARSS